MCTIVEHVLTYPGLFQLISIILTWQQENCQPNADWWKKNILPIFRNRSISEGSEVFSRIIAIFRKGAWYWNALIFSSLMEVLSFCCTSSDNHPAVVFRSLQQLGLSESGAATSFCCSEANIFNRVETQCLISMQPQRSVHQDLKPWINTETLSPNRLA